MAALWKRRTLRSVKLNSYPTFIAIRNLIHFVALYFATGKDRQAEHNHEQSDVLFQQAQTWPWRY